MRFVGPTRNATPNRATMKANPQSLGGNQPAKSSSRRYVSLDAAGIVSLVGLPRPTTRPILVGDRQTLRALRAAEMAAWEAGSSGVLKERCQASQPTTLPATPAPRLPAPLRAGSEGWGIMILAVCAVAGLFVGMQDLNTLLDGWGRILDGIRLLIQ